VSRPLALGSVLLALACGAGAAYAGSAVEPVLPRFKLATGNFGADAAWYLRNIPFIEIDDREIQQIYYYRWKVFRSHIREIGAEGTTVLEFLDNVPWARQPYTDLNDSAAFHIAEGRWLRDPRVVEDLIDHLYAGGGNDRHFSESIAAATEGFTRVTGDPSIGLRHLRQMQNIFNQWSDHWDPVRGLYWIEPLLDATEYSIASIDASGAGFTTSPSTDQDHNGFTGGYAFRPSINSYQYGNALAIARFARIAGDSDLAADFTQRADRLRSAVLDTLWNPAAQSFEDRYQASTQTVNAGDFIRGRELVGYLPWMFELPPMHTDDAYENAWLHVLDRQGFAGEDGLRTVEPSYPHYLQQYRYDKASGNRECQWNGPSWPFQTSQLLTALANLLNDYSQTVVSRADYLRLLRQYTHQHFAAPGEADLEEDYDPDSGGPIVGLPRSHHYLHSTFVDLVVSGLIGVRPRSDEILDIVPLVSNESSSGEPSIRYYALQGLSVHGHDIGIYYDVSGDRYRIGPGLSVFVDGKRRYGPGALARVSLPLVTEIKAGNRRRVDLAVNVGIADGPMAKASSPGAPPSEILQAIDGRMWFFPSNPNGWSPDVDGSRSSWYSVDFKQSQIVGSVELYFFADQGKYRAPRKYRVQQLSGAGWRDISGAHRAPDAPRANGANLVTFPPVATQALRIVFDNPSRPYSFRLIELKAFPP
jgi:F5/8 type C domain/Amylo-alpha-1,6-glucosidase